MVSDERSFEKISTEDLQRLGDIARIDREELFERKPKYRPLEEKIIAVALCQGAALHYCNGKTGIKDFDVWTFYARHPGLKFPPRRNKARDFGDPKFGKSPDKPEYEGRRVDLLGRSLDVDAGTDPVEALHLYLRQQRTSTAVKLAEKAVVLIEPARLIGFVVWNPGL
jgi:hypothetical protein